MSSMNISDKGLKFIASFEGWRNVAYKDAVGFPTIGVGHLIKAGETFPGPLSDEEVMDLFKRDLNVFVDALHKVLPTLLLDSSSCSSELPTRSFLTQHEFDALISLTYNIGMGNFKKSTLLKKLLAHDYNGAADQFLLWNKAGGKVLKGLTKRRTAERKLFLTGIYENNV